MTRRGTITRFLNFENCGVLGAGGYGIVITSPIRRKVFKLLYDVTECGALEKEAAIQYRASELFAQQLPAVRVPTLHHVFTRPVTYNKVQYLCGIEMELLRPPEGFDEQVHMLLGYKEDDIDAEWGRQMGQPVSVANPTRGFFASPDTLELIWQREGTAAAMTPERLAYLMGRSLRLLVDNGIIPIDVEWVWSDGHPYIIDFGLCEFGYVDPFVFLKKAGLRGLADDIYVPHEGDKGYDEFMDGYFSPALL